MAGAKRQTADGEIAVEDDGNNIDEYNEQPKWTDKIVDFVKNIPAKLKELCKKKENKAEQPEDIQEEPEKEATNEEE
jgi:hypothetical protein